MINVNIIQNLYYLVLSIISPLLFYYFINNSISYNIIYLTIGSFFVVSLVSTFMSKKNKISASHILIMHKESHNSRSELQ